jgi:hypothetical protein
MVVPVLSQRGQELGHFGFGEMLADAVVRISLAPDWSHYSAFD